MANPATNAGKKILELPSSHKADILTKRRRVHSKKDRMEKAIPHMLISLQCR